MFVSARKAQPLASGGLQALVTDPCGCLQPASQHTRRVECRVADRSSMNQ